VLAGVARAQASPAELCAALPAALVPSLPGQPVANLSVSPEGLGAPGVLTLRVRVEGWVLQASLSVRAERRWDERGGLLDLWAGGTLERTLAYGPLQAADNGVYTFTLRAQVCYRLNGVVTGETLTQEARVPVFIPWATADLPRLLWREAEAANYVKGLANDVAGGQPMFIEGLVVGLADPVRAMLRDYLVKGYLNEGHYPPRCAGTCYAVAPVQLRLYAVDGARAGGLFQQGWAQLGLYGGHKDSRAFEVGGKGVAGVLLVRGYRHDYILLSGKGDFSDPQVQVVEMPKGGAETLRQALALAALQSQAKEVRP
jgi:hypothetical protein